MDASRTTSGLTCGLLLLLTARAAPAQAMPVLEFNPTIPGFKGGAGEPSTWSAENVYPGAMLYVYPFRPFAGDFTARFRQTLLRDLVKEDVRETRLLAPPAIDKLDVPGAEATLFARMVDEYWGTARHRLRIAVFAKSSVAIVDYVSHDADSFQRSLVGVSEMVKTMKVGTKQAPKPRTAQELASAKSVAGLYLGSALQFVPSPVLGATPGSGTWMPGTRFYLLSPDGKVYRGYRLPKAPGGDVGRFDFEHAKAEDPYNSGVFFVDGDRVVLRFGGGISPEEQTSRLPRAAGPLEINGTTYARQQLK